ncbi:MAG: hypothetical protein ACFFA5_04690 [Promethearchaeota archaeon]
MSCPLCGATINSPEELIAHLKEEHGIEIDQDFMKNLMEGLGSFFAEMFSGKSDMSSETEDNKEADPSLFFGNMMEQLMKTITESIEGLKDIDMQGMPNPFAMMMKNMFDQSIQTEPEPGDETPSSAKNEDEAKFNENSIEINFSSDDDEEKKKDKKESDE